MADGGLELTCRGPARASCSDVIPGLVPGVTGGAWAGTWPLGQSALTQILGIWSGDAGLPNSTDLESHIN
jgi:hypothetical protein